MHRFFAGLLFVVAACSPSGNADRLNSARQTKAANAAIEEARQIASRTWKLEVIALDGDRLSVTISSGSDEKILLITRQHTRWMAFRNLGDEVMAGSAVRFQFNPDGFNEANISDPEGNANPAFYLSPAVPVQKNHSEAVSAFPGGRLLLFDLTAKAWQSKLCLL